MHLLSESFTGDVTFEMLHLCQIILLHFTVNTSQGLRLQQCQASRKTFASRGHCDRSPFAS